MKRICVLVLMLVWVFCAGAVEKSTTIVYINGSKYYIHTVRPGETLYALSKTYEIGEKVILENNPSLIEGLKADASIKIPCISNVAELPSEKSDKKLRKEFNIHYVLKGETLYSISRQYEIPIQTVIADNPGIDPIHLRLGERMLIRKKQVGSEDETGNKEQWEAYRKSLNSVAPAGTAYHIVAPGETFYSLSRRFGISEAELGTLNEGLKAADLKAGAMIKVPTESTTPAQTVAQSPSDTEPIAPVITLPTEVQEPQSAQQIEFRALRRNEPVNVALMLPFSVNGAANANYLEFYQGFLLGLDSVKTRYGCSVNVTLYDTERNPEKIRQIVESDALQQTDLIVGPVYEEALDPVVRFAEQQQIPVVSPLANLSKTSSDVLFQLAPDPAYKWEKAADLINGDRKVTLIYSGSTDKEFEQEILTLLGDSPYEKYTYKYTHPSAASNSSGLTSLLESDREQLFIVLADKEVDVDRVLAAIASADTSISSRGHAAPRFVVLGNSRWNRYNNIDRTVFFKDRIVFISTYHAKRDAQVVLDFDRAYIRSFGSVPSLYSYRGYDAALIFCPAMYDEIRYAMEGGHYTPLQTTYRFGPDTNSRNHVNRNWMRVNYNNDYTITTE